MKRSKRWRAIGGAVVAMTLAVSMLPLVALAGNSDNPNHPDYWEERYPNAIACYKYTGDSSHGKIVDNGTAVRLYDFNQGWPGDRWEVLVVKGGQNGREVYELPQGGVDYHTPKNENGKYAEVSHWIVCKGETPDTDQPIADPEWEVTPESLVCNPQTGEYEGQSDGNITFLSFDNGSWDASNLTGLSAGIYGPFSASAASGYVFGSTGTDSFSTGEVEVGTTGADDPCDRLVTAVTPQIVQSQECGIEGTLTIPATEGVRYLLDGAEIEAGVHTGPIAGTITAEALKGYELTNPGFSVEVNISAAEPCPEVVTPVAPSLVEASECGVPDRLVVPETGGVIYLLDGVDVSGQTLEGPLSGTIVAEAAPGHELSEELAYDFTLDAAEECVGQEDEEETTTTPAPEEVDEEEVTTTTTPDEGEIDPEVEEETTSPTIPEEDIPEEDDEEETDDETQETLPFTGMGSGGVAAAAAAALAAGGALVGLSRRREDGSAS